MKAFSTAILSSLISVAWLSQATAQVILNEPFDYADTAAMLVNWSTPDGLSLDTVNGLPAPSGAHSGIATYHMWTGSTFSLMPSDGSPVILSADLWYSGNNNQRNTVGLRNGASPLFEMGFYNGTPGNGLAVRVLNFAGNPNWVTLLPYSSTTEPALGTGEENAQWIHMEATFQSTALSVRYDLGADGTWDGTYDSSGIGYANPFVDLRFGGPSGVSSAGGGFMVDNINLAVVPEPSTLALILVGGLGLALGRRIRR